jgi:hypothetical protein
MGRGAPRALVLLAYAILDASLMFPGLATAAGTHPLPPGVFVWEEDLVPGDVVQQGFRVNGSCTANFSVGARAVGETQRDVHASDAVSGDDVTPDCKVVFLGTFASAGPLRPAS